MPEYHGDSQRKKTGGRKRRNSKMKKRNLGGEFAATTVNEAKTKERDSRGSTSKVQVSQTETVSVSMPDGETVEAEIEAVRDNPANPDFVRRDIITKGTVLETSEGTARVTSRPGQDGTVNAELVEE
ncbi:MAG: 30S ribosomal protein S8e [Candidatus Nanohaloarchaea archaeon]|nr:30S ribosomal protein S8e [Candidatus Nanohaloarchaea archaeon]